MKQTIGNDARRINFLRLIYVFCALLYPALGSVYYFLGLEAAWFLYQKVALALVFAALMWLSYRSSFLVKHFYTITSAGAFIFSLHYLYVMTAHQFSYYHVIGLLLVYLVSAYVFMKVAHLYLHSAFVVISGIAILAMGVPDMQTLIFCSVSLLICAGLVTLVYGGRLRSDSSLNQLNSVFYSVFQDSTDAFLLIDPVRSAIVSCNRQAVKLLEANSEEEIIGKEDGFYLGSENKIETLYCLAEQKKNLSSFSQQLRFKTRKGREFWTEATFKKLDINQRSHLLLRIVDISSVKEIERELELSNNHLSIVKEVTTLPVVGLEFSEVVNTSLEIIAKYFPDYRIAFSYLTDERMLEVVNCKPSEFLKDIKGKTYDFSEFKDSLEGFELRLPLISNNVTEDQRFAGILTQFGQLDASAVMYIPLQRLGDRIGVLSLGYHNPHLWTLYELSTIKDIADYLALIQADFTSIQLLKESELKRESIIQSIPDQILILDNHFILHEVVNKDEQSGFYFTEEMVGNSFLNLIPPIAKDQIESALKFELDPKKSRIFEFEGSIGGEKVYFEGRINNYTNSRLLIMVRDISSRKRLDNILDAEKEVLELATYGASAEVALFKMLKSIEGISHDLFASAVLLAEDRRHVSYCISPSLSLAFQEAMKGLEIGPEVGTCGTAMFFNKRVVSEDILNDPKWESGLKVAEMEGIRTCVSVPIRSKEGEVLGSFAVYYKTLKKIPDEYIDLLERAASLSSLLMIKDNFQRNLEHSEFLYRNVVQSQSELVFRVSNELKITFANSSFMAFCDSRKVDFTGISLEELFMNDELTGIISAIDESIQTGESTNFIYKSWSKSGLPRWHEWVNTPVLTNMDGKVTEIQSVGRDVTVIKMAEEKLKRNELLLRSINANINDGIYRTNASDDLLVYANKAFLEMFGYESIDDINIKPIYHLYKETQRRDELLDIFSTKGYLSNEEVLFRRKNGSVFWGLISSTRVVEPDGKVYFDGAIRDVSDVIDTKEKLIQKNLELRKLNSELDSFVYSASHNLRSPLSSILGLINLSRIDESAESEKYLELMEKSVHRLDSFITDIINYSRNSRMDIAIREIDFKELYWDTVNNHRYLDGAAEINYEVEIETPISIATDFERLRMIVENLISNAIKFRDRYKGDSYVKGNLNATRDWITLTIADNGIGVPNDQQEKIFKMFYRATDRSSGSGIGLYIVKECIEKLSGKVEIESEVDKGTLFRLVIPNLANYKKSKENSHLKSEV